MVGRRQVAVGRAARAVVVGLADRGVAGGFDDVSGFVDHHRGVAGADAVGRLARTVGGLDHRRPAGGDRQIADRHQLVGERDAWLLDALQHVFRNPSVLQRRAHQPHRFIGRLLARRVRRENHRVLALDRVNGDADRRDVGAGDRNQRADHTRRLGILDDALLRQFLDHAHALLTQRVAKDAEHLGAPFRFAAAHAAFVNAHIGQALGRVGIGPGPAHGLADAIDPRLVVVGNGSHGPARLLKKSTRELGFSSGNRTCCHDSIDLSQLIMGIHPPRREVVTVSAR